MIDANRLTEEQAADRTQVALELVALAEEALSLALQKNRYR